MPILNRLPRRKGAGLSALLCSVGSGVLLSLACTTPVLAEPATAEGARKLTDVFQGYIGAEVFEKGFVAIAPHGESYDLTVTFDSGKLEGSEDPGILHLDPYVARLTPKPDGTWVLNSDPGPLNISWTSTKPSSDEKISLNLANCATQGTFDPKLMAFSTLSTECGSAVVKGRTPDADVDVSTGKIAVLSSSKAGGDGGADLQVDLQSVGLNGKVVDKKPDTPAMPIAFQIGSFHQSASASGVRISAIADLIALLRDNASSEKLAAVQREVKDKLRAALPLWQEVSSISRIEGAVIDTPAGAAKLSNIEQRQSLTGLVKDAHYETSLAYSGLELPRLLVPDWAETLVPAEAGYATKLSFSGLDGMAEVLIRGLDASQDPPFSKLMPVALMTRFFNGQPRYQLDLNVGASAYTVKGQGEASINPEPQANILLSATGFDAVIAALNKAKEPDIQKALFGLAFIKGLAKAGADGQLVWNVSYDIVTNKVIVNDRSFALPDPS